MTEEHIQTLLLIDKLEARITALEADSHKPVALPLSEIQTRLKVLENQIAHYAFLANDPLRPS